MWGFANSIQVSESSFKSFMNIGLSAWTFSIKKSKKLFVLKGSVRVEHNLKFVDSPSSDNGLP